VTLEQRDGLRVEQQEVVFAVQMSSPIVLLLTDYDNVNCSL